MRKLLFMLALVLGLLGSGCKAPFFKRIEGTSTSIGVTIPNEEVLELEALHYLNGEKVTVKKPSLVELESVSVQSNSYFGVIRTTSSRNSKVKVEPR